MPVNVFRIDIPVYATAYITAESADEALKIANSDLTETSVEFSDRHQSLGDSICMDGRPFTCLIDNDERIALSPIMSLNRRRYLADDIELTE